MEIIGFNFLSVIGNEQQLHEFEQKHIKTEGTLKIVDFSLIIPLIEGLTEEEKKDWNSENDAQLFKYQKKEGFILIQYETYLQSSRHVIKLLSLQMPEITFELEFTDFNEDFECKYAYNNGNEQEIYFYDVESSDDEDSDQEENPQDNTSNDSNETQASSDSQSDDERED